MEDSSDRRGLVYEHRKLIAVTVIVFISFQLIVLVPNLIDDDDTTYDISHSLTVWILPLEEESHLILDFYSSGQDAEEGVYKLIGVIIDIQPSADEEHKVYLINLPENIESIWARICFNSLEGEPFTILRIDIGQIESTTLLGRELSVLMESWLGENS